MLSLSVEKPREAGAAALLPVRWQTCAHATAPVSAPSPSLLDAHREFLHRPASGYVPEEIWKKAGKNCFKTRVQCLAAVCSC